MIFETGQSNPNYKDSDGHDALFHCDYESMIQKLN